MYPGLEGEGLRSHVQGLSPLGSFLDPSFHQVPDGYSSLPGGVLVPALSPDSTATLKDLLSPPTESLISGPFLLVLHRLGLTPGDTGYRGLSSDSCPCRQEMAWTGWETSSESPTSAGPTWRQPRVCPDGPHGRGRSRFSRCVPGVGEMGSRGVDVLRVSVSG